MSIGKGVFRTESLIHAFVKHKLVPSARNWYTRPTMKRTHNAAPRSSQWQVHSNGVYDTMESQKKGLTSPVERRGGGRESFPGTRVLCVR